MRYFFLALICLSTGLLSAQTQPEYASGELLHQLKKLQTVGSVLYVAAHPDDENTRLLAYLANEKRMRTGYLSLTRGDGGQNLIGKEQGELLGLIRTQELLAARRTDGAEQFFTRANDFGFSKNPEETFTIWNRDSVLADVVWAIRKFRPDVIICRFPTTGEGGHGHHTASAILAEEAFDAAGDPSRFPEQLKYVNVWQPKRLFWNTFNFGSTNTTSEDQLKIDVGIYNPLLGAYYGEIAANSRSMHKSQGFGSAKGRGSSIEYFKQLKGSTAKTDPFEGVVSEWKQFPETAKLQQLITACIQSFNAERPEKSVDQLVAIYRELKKLPAGKYDLNVIRDRKLRETEQLILACSGFWAEAVSTAYNTVPGTPADLTLTALARFAVPIQLKSITYSFEKVDSTTNLALEHNKLYTFKHSGIVPENHPYSDPYWLRETHTNGLYNVADPLLRGIPENSGALSVVFHVSIGGESFAVQRDVVYKYVDPVKGEIYRPFELLPPATVNISEPVFVYADNNPKTIQVRVKANQANVHGKLELKAPQGWNISIPKPDVHLAAKGEEVLIDAIVSPAVSGNTSPTPGGMLTTMRNGGNGSTTALSSNATYVPDGLLTATLKIGDKSYGKAIERIEYDHIPYQFILRDATAKLVRLDVKKQGTKIAYIPGAGDDVATCLEQIGYSVTILTDELLDNADLSQFDAILTGVRAYNTNQRLGVHYQKLMDYVKNGGNLVVQYNTNSRVGPVAGKIGPYPFTVSRNRVTDETAMVTFTQPQHSVLTYPNRITESDFQNWIQERGIYFASDLDSNYQTVLTMHDPNEQPDGGSLIIAKHGKGNFVYTGLVFFRELPAGVPGAYRLLVNLLSIPENKTN